MGHGSGLLGRWATAARAAPTEPAVVASAGAMDRRELLERVYGAAACCRAGGSVRVAGDDVRVWLAWLAGSALAGSRFEFAADGRRELPGRGRAPTTIAPETTPWLTVRTSGTTGRSRRLVRDQATWLRCARAEASRLTLCCSDRVLALGHPAFSLTPYAATGALRLGAAFGVLESVDRDRAHAVLTRLAPTIVYGAPPLVAALARCCRFGRAGAGVRQIIAGGARLTVTQMQAMRQAWPFARITTFYGTAETSIVALNDCPDPYDAADIGTLFGDVEAHADRAGRLRLRTPYAALGVAGERGSIEPLTDSDGWLTLADRVEFSDDGRLRLAGRDDDRINVAGALVDPSPAERTLERLDWVAEAAVVGIAEARRSTAAVAVVLPSRVVPVDASKRVRRALSAAGIAFTVTRVVCLETEPPRTAGGKLDRQALARGCAETAR